MGLGEAGAHLPPVRHGQVLTPSIRVRASFVLSEGPHQPRLSQRHSVSRAGGAGSDTLYSDCYSDCLLPKLSL